MLWIIFLLLSALLILVLLYFTRIRQKNEPPLDQGVVPWLGHALEFKNDAAKFLTRMKDKHGDIFTVRVAGRFVTVLLDPNSYDAVVNDTESLDLTNNRAQLQNRIFSLVLPGIQPKERKWMEQHFKGLSLSNLNMAMNTHLQSLLLADHKGCNPSQWTEDGLFSLCYSLLFSAGYLTLFESRDNDAAVYKEFRKFDDLLPKLARGSLQKEESKTANSAREQLWQLLSPDRLDGGSESTSWQRSYCHFLQQAGVDADMQKKASLLQLWTTQCNAGPAAFWLLGFLLTHPEAMEAVKSEIRDLALRDSSLQHAPVVALETHRTPVLDSVLSETLRLTAAVLITREVTKNKIVHMANGREYHLRQGDKVCLFPFLSPQMDPEIHQDPQIFKYDRFLNEDLSVKDKFYKNEKRLKYYTMPWGAGKNMCVGKEFAVATIKQFVFLILTKLDLEMCDPGAELPPVNPGRYGFGMLQPDGDVQIRYRRRRTSNGMFP